VSGDRVGPNGDTMRNCLIMGSGRSGTSLVAGLLDRAGYHTGDNYLAARRANPHGFFEDFTVNEVNDQLLDPYRRTYRRPVLRRRMVPWLKQVREPGWLIPPPHGPLAVTADTDLQIKQLVADEPFAYKDPRLSYTLPAWRPHLPDDTRFVVVFRHPAATLDSIARERSEQPIGSRFPYDFDRLVAMWRGVYGRILDHADEGGEWRFVHFDQLVVGDGVARLGAFLDVDLDGAFVDGRASRARASATLPRPALDLYQRLCGLAGHTVAD
jgi:hypothetical protein